MKIKLAVVTSILLLTGPALATTPEERALYAKVRAVFGAGRDAIRTVGCDYTASFSGIDRKCRYARDGEKFYHASVDVSPEGRGMAVEGSWDGQVAYYRRNIGHFVRGRDKVDAKPSCETPEMAAWIYLDHAFGFRERSNLTFQLLAARRMEYQGQDCVELEFHSQANGGKLISRHAKQFGYHPVSTELFNDRGVRVFEMANPRYQRIEVDGNALFYPVHVTKRSWRPDGTAGNFMAFEVDSKTLQVNVPIPGSRFVLEPWPCDYVFEMDSGKSLPPVDPKWTPRGKIAFPYDIFLEVVPPGMELGDSGATSQPFVPTSRLASNPAGPGLLIWTGVLSLGVLLTVVGVTWRRHQRRSTP